MSRSLPFRSRRNNDKNKQNSVSPSPELGVASSSGTSFHATGLAGEPSRTSRWRSSIKSSFKRNKDKGGASEQRPEMQEMPPAVSAATVATAEVNMQPAGNSVEETGASVNGMETPQPKATGPPVESFPEPEDTALESVPPTSTGIWDRVCQELDAETRDWLGSIPKTDDKLQAEEIADLVRMKEEEYESASPKLKVGTREIIWRDYANRIVTWVTTIGDISVSFAPAPAAPVWSALKVLLTAHVSGCEQMTAMLGFASRFLRIIRRGQVYEVVFGLSRPDLDDNTMDLRDAIVDIYRDSLRILCLVEKRLGDKGCMQLLRALVEPKRIESALSSLTGLENELDRAVQTCQAVSSLAYDDEQQRLLESLQQPLRRVDKGVQKCLRDIGNAVKREAINYISSVRVHDHHEAKKDSRVPHTCEWLLEHEDFLAWEDSSWSSTLWLRGQMGVGKSYLTSKVIDRYLSLPGAAVSLAGSPKGNDEGFAFFYCDRSLSDRTSATSILRSFIAQLAGTSSNRSAVHPRIEQLFGCPDAIRPGLGFDMCKRLLVDLINTYPRSTLVLDALDECDKESRVRLVEVFGELVDLVKRPVKVFISSRPESGIGRLLYTGSLVEIGTEDNREDIARYINGRMTRRAATDDLEWSRELEQKVRQTLLDKSDGMFKWVQLQWEQLLLIRSEAEISNRLEVLPEGLSAAYSEIYLERKGHDQEILRRAVQWTWTTGIGLGTADALVDMVRLHVFEQDGPGGVDLLRLGVDPHPVSVSALDDVCRHLLVPAPSNSLRIPYVFPHASILEFFERQHAVWFEDAHDYVATLMMVALYECYTHWEPPNDWIRRQDWLFYQSQHRNPRDVTDPRHRLQTHAFDNWWAHVLHITRTRTPSRLFTRALIQLLGGTHPQATLPPHFLAMKRHASISMTLGPNTSRCLSQWKAPILMACRLGSIAFLEEWLVHGGDVRHQAGLLTAAAGGGFDAICSKLISLGCSVNEYDGNNPHTPTPLMAAISGHYPATGRLLLNSGADPNTERAAHKSSLCMALLLCGELVPALLDAGAWVAYEAKGRPRSVLEDVVDDWHLYNAPEELMTALELMKERGADLDPDYVCCGSLLAYAAHKCCLDFIAILGSLGVDVNRPLREGFYGSALAAALLAPKVDVHIIIFMVHILGADVKLLTTNPPAKPVWAPWFPYCQLDHVHIYSRCYCHCYWFANFVQRSVEYLAEDCGLHGQMLVDMGFPDNVVAHL